MPGCRAADPLWTKCYINKSDGKSRHLGAFFRLARCTVPAIRITDEGDCCEREPTMRNVALSTLFRTRSGVAVSSWIITPRGAMPNATIEAMIDQQPAAERI